MKPVFSAARRAVSALAAVLIIAAPLQPVRAAADPFEIDVILSLTGPFAFLGTSEAASIKALEPLINRHGGINGQPVHFVVYDDQTQPATAVQLANTIIAKKPR